MKPSAWLNEFRPANLIPAVSAGLVAGVLGVILQISFAALVFGGDLSPFLSRGIGLALAGGVIFAAVVALTSSFPVSIASPQDSPAAILALVTITISAVLSAGPNSAVTLQTVIASIAVSTLLTGVVFFALGRFKLGRLVRFIPYPVVGGFLAGTGWLLMQGGVNVMTGAQLTPEWIYILSQPVVVVRWVPGVVLALVLVVILRRWSHALITPTIILVAIGLFYLALPSTGLTVESARDRSWMLGPFPPNSLFQFLTPTAFQDANWLALLGQADKIVTVAIVSTIALLLNVSGIELAVQKDMDVSRELESAGLANILAGLAAGFPGYHLLGATTLSYKFGARSRVTGLTAALLILFTLLFGASLLEYVPRPVLGGLLVFLGISFLVDWLYDAFFRLSRTEYALIVLILVVIAVFGFLPGVGVGLVVSMILFILNYSRIHVVKHSLSGAGFRSAVERSPSERARLREQGEQILILRLQEFIFFGTGQQLLDTVREHIQDPTKPSLRFLVLDFRRVPGLDSSAIASFTRLLQLTRAQNIETLFTEVARPIRPQLERGGIKNIEYFSTLDAGVEWCENRILADDPSPLDTIHDTLQSQLMEFLPRLEDRERLTSYLERIDVPVDTLLIRQGDMADALYFIEQGSVSVDIELGDRQKVRFRTATSGSILGEIGVYLHGARTASVTTIQPTVVYRFSMQALRRMEAQDPILAAGIHKWIATIMAERLADSARTLEAVMN